MLKSQFERLGVFSFVVQMLKEAKNDQLPEDIVLEELAMRLPTEDTETLFKTLVAWGRFAELLHYEDNVLSLEK